MYYVQALHQPRACQAWFYLIIMKIICVENGNYSHFKMRKWRLRVMIYLPEVTQPEMSKTVQNLLSFPEQYSLSDKR